MRTILIVGGSQGIGKAILDEMKESHVVINISRKEIDYHPNVHHITCDVLNDELPEIEREIHGLVYCPGSINLKAFSRLSMDDFQNDFEINVKGAVKVLKKYIGNLDGNFGSVVLFSTVAAQVGMPYHSSIAVSKSAVEGLTKSLAAEYATKIRFNCIAPTITKTPLAARLLRNDKQIELMKERHPLKRILDPSEVASFAAYLLDEKAPAVTGQIFPIDAGLVSVKI